MAKGVKWSTEEQRREAKREAQRKFRLKVMQDPILKEKLNRYWRELRERKREANPKEHAKSLAKRRKRDKICPKAIKSRLTGDWKRRGVVDRDGDKYNIMYDYYQQCHKCECCGTKFGKYGDGTGTHKCLDHCHKTGEMRSVVCHRCNIRLGE